MMMKSLVLSALFFSLPLVGVCAAATPVQAASGAALVLRFDDNKPAAQWREVAEIFEAVGGRCSFAVNPAGLNEEQWAALRDLASRVCQLKIRKSRSRPSPRAFSACGLHNF